MASTLVQRSVRVLVITGILLVVLVVIFGLASRWVYERSLVLESPSAETPLAEGPLVEEPQAESPSRSAGREPRAPDSLLLAVARRIQGDGRQESCGSYRLVTDVEGDRGPQLCRRLAAGLDAAFEALYGISPRGIPKEGVFLFADREDFRQFAREDGRLRTGYGGYANGARGFVALPWQQGDPQAVATTLAHELTHLVLRRALGPGLPPWLSEGLADGIGDSATPQGLQEMRGLVGVEGQARRLRDAYRQGLVPSLERLVVLSREQFDRSTATQPVPYDYEQSALFVRYLLAEPTRARGFRSFLGQLARGEQYRPDLLTEALGLSWARLDDGLRNWVQAEL